MTQSPTPARQAALLALLLEQDAEPAAAPASPAPAAAPLSFSQQRLWFLLQYEPGSTAYNQTRAFVLRGALDRRALQAALRAVIARHPALRTRFVADDAAPGSLPRQVVESAPAFALAEATLAAGPDALQACLDAEAARPFDLSQAPLLRATLLTRGHDDHLLLLSLHHIVSDAVSNAVIARDLGTAYAQALADDEIALPAPATTFAAHASRQRERLASGDLNAQRAWWQRQLGNHVPALQLPTDRPHGNPAPRVARRIDALLDLPLLEALRRFCAVQRCTPFVVLLAAWQALLSRYAGQDDFAVGVPHAGRDGDGLDDVVGFFANTHVYRSRTAPGITGRALCEQLRADALGALGHAELPFEVLLDGMQVPRDAGRSPLFQVMFNLRTTTTPGALALPGLQVQAVEARQTGAKFDLILDVEDRGDGMALSLEYDCALFDAATAHRMLRHYLAQLGGLLDQPELPLAATPLLGDDDATLAHQHAAGQPARHVAAELAHRRIQRHAEQQPQAVALRHGDTTLTYGELERRANRLAHRLIALGVGPEVRVGIAMERSPEMIVGLLAILKAGGAYVPFDPAYPAERLAYLFEDSGIAALLTQPALRGLLPQRDGLPVLELDSQDDGAAWPEHAPTVEVRHEHLAYVIYTSGSTGRPKGAQLQHGNLSRLLAATQHWFGFGPADVWTLFHSYAFDFSVWEIFGALCHGGQLVIVPFHVSRAPQEFIALLQRERVTVLNQTPSAFRALLAQPELYGAPLALRYVIFGGEALDPHALRPWIDRFGDASPQLVNMYGITETTVHVTYRPITRADLDPSSRARSPIGERIPDLGVRVLDAGLNLVPPGVAGELYIAGDGLARGYLNRPGLTAERFVPDPFAGDGARLYRTGDLARWLPDGQLEYLGRIDQQLKIRGFRIEPGEIEARILAQTGVANAAVIAAEGPSGARLVAYVVPAGGATVEGATLRTALAAELPDYMVPAAFVVLDTLPLTPNGKLDRRALPAPAFDSAQDFVAPEGDAETALATIWSEVLNLPRVGRADNFFELGGDSILSLQIVARARAAGWVLTPRQLFERQTLAELAAVATPVAQDAVEGNVVPEGAVPLLPIQADFFDTPMARRHHWNQSVLLDCREAPELPALAAALRDLVAHHDALRLRFVLRDGAWHQAYADSEACPDLLWVRHAASEAERLAHCEAAQRSLDLAEGPLLRAVALQCGKRWQLLLVIHHLVVDGVSWRVLVEDLRDAYQQRRQGQQAVLPARTASYQRWSQALRAHAATRDAELPHWQALAQVDATLPCDDPAGPLTIAERDAVTLTLPADLTQALLQRAPAAYRTRVNDLLLTALARALTGWSGRTQVLIDLESHGRVAGVDDTLDLSRTVGWFTTLFPVALDGSGTPDGAIKAVKEQLRAVPGEGIGFGLLRRFGSTAQQAALAGVPKPEVVFNYLGQLDASFAEDSPWRLSSGSVGANQDPAALLSHPLSVSGQVLDGELRLTLAFSRARHRAETVHRLAEALREELEALIAHCTSGAAGVTPGDFPLARLTQAGLDALELDPAQVLDLYPLSPMQAGMLFHSVLAPEGSAYTNQLRVDIDGLDPGRFIAAWQSALVRHDSLRCGFLHRGEQPLQWVARSVQLPVTHEDWSGRDVVELDRFAAAELAKRFDLERPPLTRLALLRTGAQRHHLVWTVHHLLLDGWSTAQLLGEVLRHYAGEALPASGGRFADYIGWLQSRDAAAGEAFWKAQLASLDAPTRLLAALPAPEQGQGQGEHHHELDAAETTALAGFARAQKVTLNTLVQAAWLLLLQRCTGQPCVAFGATVAGRPAELPAAQQMLGLFINTLPVIASPRPQQPVGDWLREVQALNLALREHEHTPLYNIQRWAGQAGQALFDSIVVFENYPVDAALRRTPAGLSFSGVRNRAETNYPLALVFAHTDTLRLTCRFDRSALGEPQARMLAHSLFSVLRQLAADAARPLGRIGLASADAPLAVASTAAQLAHHRFEAHAASTPDAVALAVDDVQLTYRELNRRANALAHRLAARGVGPDVRVGVLAERSVEMVVALLAVLKAGGAYVPFDPDYPADRLAYMIEDSGVALVLVQRPDAIAPLPAAVPVLELGTPALYDGEHANPSPALHPHHLAYVIYTSGSTGRPKGVGIAHGALAHYLQGVLSQLALAPASRMAMVSTPAADLGHTVLFGALASGGVLHLPARRCVFDAAAFARYMTQHRIGVLKIVPGHLGALLDGAQAAGVPLADILPDHTLVLGGEATDAALRARLHAARPACRLVNHYGPTETTVGVLVHVAGTTPQPGLGLPLGQPLRGTGAYVMDAALCPQPDGIAGELYVGGPALARGYLGRAALTADRFVPDPFAGDGARLYRTGDRVRRRADGVFEYLGRVDDQVKIRGFRVEPGEVAAQLAALPQVRQAAVVAAPAAGGMQLVGYAVAQTDARPDPAALCRALSATLPPHMVPAAVVLLDALPLTANGKLDRRALPAPDAAAASSPASREAPQGELETRLAGIWQALLQVPAVGRHDNFFALGGHSLLAVQLLSRIQGELGIEVPLALLFGAATLAELAAALPAQQRHADDAALLELEAFANTLESV
ncbi:Non ribosomal peptide synthase, antibiotic synthesis contains 3 condensation domains, 2 AMP-acid ligases II domains, 2 PP-binding, Phosphopantetheine attachment site (plasmid) [Cupriavidus taiwanensis]|uniref:non-ribosomal peptide synthetase n=5 Tax=Cupriavidus taiwanensis TaxID=164546 RepID=UPI000E100F31|nr:non-ribosomal peptide synthetase [Cupriavidus taiwanensis]SPD54786.1 Non ribosomal peptide synthase, antibiotic synthesis contains 3 condensation domains, 2 AMP-acid ligases II domains, 2 PP-binding, Phosphopantetheine attachment site [Cupriavidus taiwanensis]